MDNRINELRSKITALRTEMLRVEETMRDQIRQDLDSTEPALLLIAMRKQLAALIADWRAAGGRQPLPTVQERLQAGSPLPRRQRAVRIARQ